METLLFLITKHAYAADPVFVSLTNITGLTKLTADDTFPELISNLFLVTIGFAAVLGVIMITIGGLEYMASDTPMAKGNGKEKIASALQGLFIVLISYLFLYTINPDLVSLDVLNLPSVPAYGPPAATAPITIFDVIPRDAAQRAVLEKICTAAMGSIHDGALGHLFCTVP